MMKFRSILSSTSEFISNPGSPYLDQYEYEVDKKGVRSLVKTGEKKDVYSAIQADYPSTDINLLMKRFALGDASAINVREGIYADVTKMPSTYAELFDKAEDCSEYFDALPAELKQMFDNSYTQFFTELDSDQKSFNDKIQKYNDQFVDHSYDYIEPDEPIKEVDTDE